MANKQTFLVVNGGHIGGNRRPKNSGCNDYSGSGSEEPMYPVGVNVNSVGFSDLQQEIGAAILTEFQGSARLTEIIDSSNFAYALTNIDGSVTNYEVRFKVNSFGVLVVDWNSARAIAEPPLFPAGTITIKENVKVTDLSVNQDEEKLIPNIYNKYL